MALLVSCNKVLDKKPLDKYDSPIVLNTPEGADMLLNGAYSILSGRYYYGSLLYLYEAAKGPDFFVRNVSGGSSYYYENRYLESSSLNGNAKRAWQTIYSVIRNTTILIENIDNIAGDIDKLRKIKGQAYAIRGLAYFDLMRLFAYPPIFSIEGKEKYDDKFKWGVPIIKDTETGFNIFEYEIRRETADSTYKYILEQFTMAKALLEGRVVEKGRIGPAAATALLMRVNLYMGRWQDVVDLGEDWLLKYEQQYSMISYTNYTSNYYKPYNSESIWEIGYTLDNSLSSNALNYWVRKPTYEIPSSEQDGTVSQNVGYAKLGLTWGNATNGKDFLTAYNKDVRQYLICKLGIQEKPDYYGIRKYVGDPYHYIHNIPVVRLPEIYLTLAEAYFNISDNLNATIYTSMVSEARRDASTNVSSVLHILDERRREFILEGQTYWDYFRTARNITNRQIIESIDNASITFGAASGRSYRVVYPIPLAEMNANPAIRNQQNPGYAPWEFSVEEDD